MCESCVLLKWCRPLNLHLSRSRKMNPANAYLAHFCCSLRSQRSLPALGRAHQTLNKDRSQLHYAGKHCARRMSVIYSFKKKSDWRQKGNIRKTDSIRKDPQLLPPLKEIVPLSPNKVVFFQISIKASWCLHLVNSVEWKCSIFPIFGALEIFWKSLVILTHRVWPWWLTHRRASRLQLFIKYRRGQTTPPVSFVQSRIEKLIHVFRAKLFISGVTFNFIFFKKWNFTFTHLKFYFKTSFHIWFNRLKSKCCLLCFVSPSISRFTRTRDTSCRSAAGSSWLTPWLVTSEAACSMCHRCSANRAMTMTTTSEGGCSWAALDSCVCRFVCSEHL